MKHFAALSWRRVALIAIGFNAFLLGGFGVIGWNTYAAGQAAMPWTIDAAPAPPPLNAEELKRLRAALRPTGARVQEFMADTRADRAELQRVFAAEKFDPIEAARILARTRAAEDRLKADLDKIFVEFASQLPPNRRMAVNDVLRPGRRALDACATRRADAPRS